MSSTSAFLQLAAEGQGSHAWAVIMPLCLLEMQLGYQGVSVMEST